MEISLKVSLACDIGCTRTNNEDLILISGETYRNANEESSAIIKDHGRFVAAVADGMGGHNAGEIASEMAVKSFDDFILTLPEGLSDTDFRRKLDEEIVNIHRKLNQYGLSNSDCIGLGTTLVAWLTYGNRIYTVNCGDSRIYRYRNGIICQLTTDHSEQSRTGDLSIPLNQIYNCLGGGGETAFADIMEITSRVFDEDVFILCSDGLSDVLTDEDMELLLSDNSSASGLVEKAREKRCSDNVSVVILTVNRIH